MDESKIWEERYKDLEKHHTEETTFLIEEVMRLRKHAIDSIMAEVILGALSVCDSEGISGIADYETNSGEEYQHAYVKLVKLLYDKYPEIVEKYVYQDITNILGEGI